MKRLILILFLTSSCEVLNDPPRNGRVKTTYYVVNETGYDMEVQSFVYGKKCDKISIKAGSTFEKNVEFSYCYMCHEQFYNYGVFDNLKNNEDKGARDSLVITYGNERQTIEYFNPRGKRVNPKNTLLEPYAHDIGKGDRVDRLRRIVYKGPFQMVFTKEDFDNAVPIKD